MIRRKDKILEQSIQRLNISDEVIKRLEENRVININELCNKTKKELKEMELNQNEIDNIQIKLQEEGLNLRGSL